MDLLKDLKSSLRKDFIRYKRALSSGSANSAIELLEEAARVQQFINPTDTRKSKHYIFITLRDEIKRTVNHEVLLVACLDLIFQRLEDQMYLLPEERFRLHRVIPFIIALLDGDSDSGRSSNIFRNGKVKVKELQAFFQDNIVAPLIGDVIISLEIILKLAPNYDITRRGLWGANAASDRNVSSGYDVTGYWHKIRLSYGDYTARLTAALGRCRKYPFEKTLDEATIEVASELFQLVQDALRKTSRWAVTVQQSIAWKLSHPRSADDIAEDDLAAITDGLEYALGLKFNIRSSELTALADIIWMIKSLHQQLVSAQSVLTPYLQLHVHHVVQQLVQGDLTPLLHRLDKRSRPLLPTLLNIRAMAADWHGDLADKAFYDFRDYTRKQGRIIVQDHPARIVAPAQSQLTILRMEIAAMMHETSEARSTTSVFSKTDLEGSDIEMFSAFLSKSFYFPYVLNYAQHMTTIADMSFLWSRELFMDIAQSVQLPIDLSMPWVLLSHVVQQAKTTPQLLTHCLVLFDIYNDAASRALYIFNEQFLYDEVEAEANLAADQLVCLLADEIYEHYKLKASRRILDQGLALRLEELKEESYLHVECASYIDTILQQRAVPLLGRSIDLAFLFTQNITSSLRRDLETAIARFESGDARGLVDLHHLLQLLQGTHALFAAHLTAMDPFDHLLHEVDESLSPTGFRGRIALHLATMLGTDLLPNFCFNFTTRRFIPAPVPVRPKDFLKGPKHAVIQAAYGNADLFKAFDSLARLSRGFFGPPHIEVILALPANVSLIPVMVDQLQRLVGDRLQDLAEFLEALGAAIEVDLRPPAAARGKALALYEHYASALGGLLSYDDLQPEVFQAFRELGNALALFSELSQALQQRQSTIKSFLHGVNDVLPMDHLTQRDQGEHASTVVSPLSAILKRAHDTGLGPSKSHQATERALFQARNAAHDISTHQNDTEHRALHLDRWLMARLEEQLYQQSLATDWSLFDDQSRTGNDAVYMKKLLIGLGTGQSFARLWVQLLFVFCLDDAQQDSDRAPLLYDGEGTEAGEGSSAAGGAVTNAAEFGHGWALGGAMLLHLLKQRPAFELLDVCRRVIHLSTFDQTSGDDQQEMKRFVHAAERQRALLQRSFVILEALHEPKPSYTKASVFTGAFTAQDLYGA